MRCEGFGVPVRNSAAPKGRDRESVITAIALPQREENN